MELADLLITTAIAVIGLYLTNSLRRQQRLRIAEKRLDAYREMWALTWIARPTLLKEVEGGEPLSRDDAATLYKQTTKWYFGNGNGMLLTEPTKKLYLAAKENLGLYSIGTSDDWRADGRRVMHQLSLLRTQMKLDLDMYGASYFEEELDDEDHDFLRAAGIDPARWGGPSRLQLLRARLRGRPAA